MSPLVNVIFYSATRNYSSIFSCVTSAIQEKVFQLFRNQTVSSSVPACCQTTCLLKLWRISLDHIMHFQLSSLSEYFWNPLLELLSLYYLYNQFIWPFFIKKHLLNIITVLLLFSYFQKRALPSEVRFLCTVWRYILGYLNPLLSSFLS